MNKLISSADYFEIIFSTAGKHNFNATRKVNDGLVNGLLYECASRRTNQRDLKVGAKKTLLVQLCHASGRSSPRCWIEGRMRAVQRTWVSVIKKKYYALEYPGKSLPTSVEYYGVAKENTSHNSCTFRGSMFALAYAKGCVRSFVRKNIPHAIVEHIVSL